MIAGTLEPTLIELLFDYREALSSESNPVVDRKITTLAESLGRDAQADVRAWQEYEKWQEQLAQAKRMEAGEGDAAKQGFEDAKSKYEKLSKKYGQLVHNATAGDVPKLKQLREAAESAYESVMEIQTQVHHHDTLRNAGGSDGFQQRIDRLRHDNPDLIPDD